MVTSHKRCLTCVSDVARPGLAASALPNKVTPPSFLWLSSPRFMPSPTAARQQDYSCAAEIASHVVCMATHLVPILAWLRIRLATRIGHI